MTFGRTPLRLLFHKAFWVAIGLSSAPIISPRNWAGTDSGGDHFLGSNGARNAMVMV